MVFGGIHPVKVPRPALNSASGKNLEILNLKMLKFLQVAPHLVISSFGTFTSCYRLSKKIESVFHEKIRLSKSWLKKFAACAKKFPKSRTMVNILAKIP